ncbi:hypothetical protein CR513_54665, partial [Mucuna pruriens]
YWVHFVLLPLLSLLLEEIEGRRKELGDNIPHQPRACIHLKIGEEAANTIKMDYIDIQEHQDCIDQLIQIQLRTTATSISEYRLHLLLTGCDSAKLSIFTIRSHSQQKRWFVRFTISKEQLTTCLTNKKRSYRCSKLFQDWDTQQKWKLKNMHSKQSKLLWPVNFQYKLRNMKSINKTYKLKFGRRMAPVKALVASETQPKTLQAKEYSRSSDLAYLIPSRSSLLFCHWCHCSSCSSYQVLFFCSNLACFSGHHQPPSSEFLASNPQHLDHLSLLAPTQVFLIWFLSSLCYWSPLFSGRCLRPASFLTDAMNKNKEMIRVVLQIPYTRNRISMSDSTHSLSSKALNLSKPIYEKESMALVLSIQHWWCPYRLGRKLTVLTDQKSLKHLLEQRITTQNQQNWLAKPLGYEL